MPALDGIRGIAVLGVLLHHLDRLTGGYLGVDTFFVLSGFLITGILLDEHGRTDRVGLGRFWLRRARRLIPALVVVLAVVLLVEGLLLDGISESLRRETWAAVFYVSNWVAIIDGTDYWATFDTVSPLRHMWSLAIEEQFYVVWPLLVIAVFAVARRRGWNGPRTLAVAAGALAAVSYLLAQMLWSPANTLRVYYGTDTRVGAILLGAVAAVVVFETAPSTRAITWVGRLALVGLVPITAAWVALDGQSELLYRVGFPVTALATTVVIASTVLQPDALLVRAMSNAVLRWFGTISYGLYLWHWPIIVWLDPDRTGWDGLALDSVRVILSVGVAALSYHLIEQPIRHSDWGGRRTALASIAALAVVAIGATATSAGATADRPPPGTRSDVAIPAPPTTTAAITTTVREPADEATPTTTDADPPVDDGDASEPPRDPSDLRVMVVGDSGAYFLGELMYDLTVDEPGAPVVLPRGEIGCGVITAGGGISTELGFIADPAECDAWPDRWTADIEAFQPTDVLINYAWVGIGDREIDGSVHHVCEPEFDQAHGEAFDLAISTAAATGAVVQLTTVADVVGSGAGVDAAAQRIDCINATIRRAAARALDHGIDVRVIEFGDWLCPDLPCRTEIDGETIRPDKIHIEGPGGHPVIRWLLEELR